MFALKLCSVFAVVCVSYATSEDEQPPFSLEEFSAMESKISQLQEVNSELFSRVKAMEDNMAKLEVEHADHKRHISTPAREVAFLASVEQDQHGLSVGSTIIFDGVLTNIGNAYNSGDGTFRCPRDGTYLFNFSVMAAGGSTGNYTEVALMVNGLIYVNAMSDERGSSGSAEYNQGSTSAILHLHKWDSVRVAVKWPRTSNQAIRGLRYNTFSGYLLSR